MVKKQIIAVGGRLLLPSDGGRLERYILAATSKKNPKVCFLGTATGDDVHHLARFYASYAPLPCRATHLPLFHRTPVDLRGFFADCDVVHVGGGNTRSMLAVWAHWSLDVILRELWERGVVLTGSSAGMICWFTQGITDSVAGKLSVMECLGFLPGSACPHYDGEADRRPSYQRFVAERACQPGIAADDGVALHYVDTQLAHVLSVSTNSTAYRVDCMTTGAYETRLDVTIVT